MTLKQRKALDTTAAMMRATNLVRRRQRRRAAALAAAERRKQAASVAYYAAQEPDRGMAVEFPEYCDSLWRICHLINGHRMRVEPPALTDLDIPDGPPVAREHHWMF